MLPQAGPILDGDARAGLINVKALRGNPMTMRFSVLSGRVRRPREGTVMNIEKYTERSRGFVQSAQSLATREGHQQFSPLHILKVLLDDPEGLAGGLIDRSGRSRWRIGGRSAAVFPCSTSPMARARA